jgi:catechol 2,3-dioxygenase-like lactoylglutathione lyase family enzyme
VFTAHHFALSVADLDVSVQFYASFGFRSRFAWEADDASLRIIHLILDGFILELFCCADNAGDPPLDQEIGNDLTRIGVKHLALHVADLQAAKRHLASAGLDTGTEITHGRTGLEYFFVRDPDGLWLEIVEDHRTDYEKAPAP